MAYYQYFEPLDEVLEVLVVFIKLKWRSKGCLSENKYLNSFRNKKYKRRLVKIPPYKDKDA